MSADLRSRHDLGEIIGLSWRVYIANFRPLFAIALIVAPLQLLAVIVTRRIDDPDIAQAVGLLFQLPSLLIGIVASVALIHAVNEIAHERAVESGAALDTGLQNFWPALTTGLLVVRGVVLSVFAAPLLGLYWRLNREATIDGRRDWYFAAIPGALLVYLLVRWAFVTNSIVIEGARSWSALDDSAAAVRGTWWRTFGVLLAIGFFQLGPVMLATAAAEAPVIVDGVTTAAASALILPFAVCAQTLLYYDLKARREPDVSPL